MALTTMATFSDATRPENVGTATKKRKADVLSRVTEGNTSSKGRGSESGWTLCPLCGRHSQKRFALGRGITAHLHAMHTPWNPGSVEHKKRKRLLKREESERKRGKKKLTSTIQQEESSETPLTCDPTPEEQEQWAQRVIQIAAELENQVKSNSSGDGEGMKPGLDRNGKQSRSYRDSLPPFVQAAADGDLHRLKVMVEECKSNLDSKEESSIQNLLDTRDRNGSTAEHWAAGGGHLFCLRFLLELRDSQRLSSTKNNDNPARIRRRDGKTCLHYAARNGHLECIQYLMEKGYRINEASGDGTTALHMACYGGHINVVEHLITLDANVHNVNDWGCGCAHWVGMTKSESATNVRELCRLLYSKGVSFSIPQKQGHSALHKAAQRNNRHVIEWMMEATGDGGAGLSSDEKEQAGKPDDGGHRPSEIWRSVGGDQSFAKRIKISFEST